MVIVITRRKGKTVHRLRKLQLMAGVTVLAGLIVATSTATAWQYYHEFTANGTHSEEFNPSSTTRHDAYPKASTTGSVMTYLQTNNGGVWGTNCWISVTNGEADCCHAVLGQGNWCRIYSSVTVNSGKAYIGGWDNSPPQAWMVCPADNEN